ncbi:hypothetical protein HY489_04130 [Candidatus Woesearchaeota archaeon]|nr:hypothetical protein [Candidatus Woesearchaeota archaeon]
MRGQVTVFILIGILVVIAFGITLYAGSSLQKKEFSQGSEQAGVQQLQDYVQTCLNLAVGEALSLLGKQGGFLYDSQGGLLQQGSVAFAKFPGSSGVLDVPYLVVPPVGDLGGVFVSNPPGYPFDSFPFSPEDGSLFFTGYYGVSKLAPLYKVTASGEPVAGSVQQSLEAFIGKKTAVCADFREFEAKGFDVVSGSGVLSLVFAQRQEQFVGEQYVTVELLWPLEVSTPGKEKVLLKDFATRVNVRLATMYYFVKSLVDGDVTDVSFAPSSSGNIKVERQSFGEDSVLVVRDEQSSLQNRPFEFVVLRKNRIPALWAIDTKPLERVVFHVTPERRGTRVVVEGNKLLFRDPCPDDGVSNPFVLELNASDPDEDVVSFVAKVVGRSESELADVGTFKVQVFAKDDANLPLDSFDSQVFDVKVALCE